MLSLIMLVTHDWPREGQWQVAQGLGRERQAMQRELGYKVYLAVYGRKREGQRGEERETEATSTEEAQEVRKWGGGQGDLLALAEAGGWEWARLVS